MTPEERCARLQAVAEAAMALACEEVWMRSENGAWIRRGAGPYMDRVRDDLAEKLLAAGPEFDWRVKP
jgi:hypothetical protein